MMILADGRIRWAIHKMVGKASVIDTEARKVTAIVDIGTETNHVNFVVLNGKTLVFATVAATNETKVWLQPDPASPPTYLTSIRSSGVEPHGLWPSPDNTRMHVVNEHSDTVNVIDLITMKVVHTMLVSQEDQALIYVAGAVPSGPGTQNLGTLGIATKPALNKLVPISGPKEHPEASALVTVRPLPGLDMFQIIGRSMQLNTSYTATASCLECTRADTAGEFQCNHADEGWVWNCAASVGIL
jgi:YVTN family beta-propeller protein